tara:strand:+ start:44 stop:502 length:459 start_codon:yes stop_codon:yes gene_type:complete
MPIFGYLTKKFDRNRRQRLTRQEYELIKNNYSEFINYNLNIIQTDNKVDLRNGYPYKTRLIILIVLGIAALAVEIIFPANSIDYKRPDWIWIIYIGLIFVGINSLVYLASFIRSFAEFYDYKADFKKYYKYHNKLVQKSTSYENYLGQKGVK